MKLLIFLQKLAERHVPNLAQGFQNLAEGRPADWDGADIPDDKLRLAAHLVSAVGQDTPDARTRMVVKACSLAIKSAEDKDVELATQLIDAIESLCAEEAAFDVEALRAQFNGTEVEIARHNGFEFYTFKGRAAYPTELRLGDRMLRLCNASYRKGIYQLVKENRQATEAAG